MENRTSSGVYLCVSRKLKHQNTATTLTFVLLILDDDKK
jgi:hypothetical protein